MTPATFKIKPQSKWIVGRVVDIDMSKGGIVLMTDKITNLTVFLLVDDVGPEVTHAQVGDVIAYITMNHIVTRDGQHCAVVLDDKDNIVGKVEGLDPSKIKIEGDDKRPAGSNGPTEIESPFAV